MSPIRCLVADDSRTFRAVLRAVLARAQGVEVVGEAEDGHQAVAEVLRLRPDVVTMDVRMPGQDGLAAIAEIMERAPTPVIVVSAEVGREAQGLSFQALDLGAIEVLGKPRGDGAAFERDAEAIRRAVRAVAGLKLVTRRRRPAPPRLPPGAVSAAPVPAAIVGVVASTGGPPAIAALLRGLPAGFAAPVLVVQHIAAGFEAGFAHWLAAEAGRTVRVAAGGEPLTPGAILVAPDGRHLVARSGLVHLTDDPPVKGFRPAGNVLLEALAREYGARAAGLVLTGMGEDGVEGLRALRARGAPTAAQGPASSVVFGMPRVALESGAAAEAVEADDLAAWVTRVAR
ncbi:MAG: chemotaxis protein CheB [Anaeromyxobacteraceae bacterium]